MQTFSGMQRNRIDQKRLISLWSLPLFIFYASLSSIYLLFPPLLGLFFVFYSRAVARKNTYDIVLISAMLIIFEAEKGYLFASTLLCFVLLEQLVMPLLKQYIVCEWCLRLLQVTLAYTAYGLMMVLLSQLFMVEMPSADWHLFYYILIEFALVSLL